jgi:hypothetical protein
MDRDDMADACCPSGDGAFERPVITWCDAIEPLEFLPFARMLEAECDKSSQKFGVEFVDLAPGIQAVGQPTDDVMGVVRRQPLM